MGTGSAAAADLVLKAACERCGTASDLNGTSCRHTTLCTDCGRAMARARGRCAVCAAPVTRLIREYDVRLDASAEKSHFIGRFTTGLPPLSKKRSAGNRWSLRQDFPQGRQLTGNMREKYYSRRPWILEDKTGEHQYQSQIEDPPATYYSLTLKGKEITAVPVGSWYNFSKVAQYKQLTLEEAEEMMNRRRSSASGHERWLMKAATNGAAAFSSDVKRLDDVNGGVTNGGHPKKGDRNENGNQSVKVEEDEEGEAARKNRLGLTTEGIDEDDEEVEKDRDFDLDDEIEKGDHWEHEETFTDDDETLDIDIEERPDLVDPEAAAPEIKQDDNENELGSSGNLSKSGEELKKLLRRAAGENESDVDDKNTDVKITILRTCICFIEDEPPLQELAPKQLVEPKSEPVDSNPAKSTPSAHAQSTTPPSKSTQKRRSGGGDANTSNGAASKKIKTEPETITPSVKDETPSSLESTSEASLPARTTELSPVTEEEVRTVLRAIAPATSQDLVSRFKNRVVTPEEKKAFLNIVRKISHLCKSNGRGYIVLRQEHK
ncbi:Transcription initiation factor IIF subunit alpha [Dichanthelium oligosanthes]|uniref:Transcription initiation factor IIF subunit alpha n=1 Tax=Dichanthelium oligosanthes TaxID=888268 RepID=A0A1E5WKT3_9POAL|nr:Transcription initiation factor IIF subunit alpha [Dichanthelium oligosanthes]